MLRILYQTLGQRRWSSSQLLKLLVRNCVVFTVMRTYGISFTLNSLSCMYISRWHECGHFFLTFIYSIDHSLFLYCTSLHHIFLTFPVFYIFPAIHIYCYRKSGDLYGLYTVRPADHSGSIFDDVIKKVNNMREIRREIEVYILG